MTLPLHMQMEIDISAAAHKRDIAEGFANLKARLIPSPTKEEAEHAMKVAYQQMLLNAASQCQTPYLNGRYLQNALMPANQASQGNSFLSGLGAPWFQTTPG